MATVTVPGAVSGGTLGITGKQALNAATPQVIWQIPPRIGTITIQVAVTSAGNYEVLCTASPVEDVLDDTADWFDIFGAAQSASRQQAIFASVTAVKVVRSTGEHTACIRGQ